MTLSFPLTLTERFAWIIRELHAAVAARIRFPPVTGAMILFICARLRKFVVEFDALAARIRAGTYAPRPAGRRRVARPTGRKGRSPILAHYEMGLPPWQPGWLHRIAPNTAGVWASALRTLFSDPEMAALIAAVPRLRRILRPLCFMLALEASLLRPAVPAPAASVSVAKTMELVPITKNDPVDTPHATGETHLIAEDVDKSTPADSIFGTA